MVVRLIFDLNGVIKIEEELKEKTK